MSHSYPSDISREQFARILPTLESVRRRTKPRTVDLYDVFCGVLYLQCPVENYPLLTIFGIRLSALLPREG